MTTRGSADDNSKARVRLMDLQDESVGRREGEDQQTEGHGVLATMLAQTGGKAPGSMWFDLDFFFCLGQCLLLEQLRELS